MTSRVEQKYPVNCGVKLSYPTTQVDSVKYLGHFLTCELNDDIDIRRQCRVLNVRGNILSRKFHMCSVPVKLKLFNSYCASLYIHHICGGIIRKCLSLNCTLHIIIY